MNRFEDKVIVITGGGSGLGRLCGHLWAAEGGKVVVTDLIDSRTDLVAKEITEAGGTAIGLKADVTVEAEVEAAVQAAVDEFGRLDIMFANAGCAVEGFGTIALEDYTEEQFRAVNKVVYDGVYFSGKHACRQFKRQGPGGNIVVTVSAGGHTAYPGFGPYCAGKAGAAGLVRSMAYDWGRYGIRVNGLSPTHGMSVNFALPPETPPLGLSYEEAGLQGAEGYENPLAGEDAPSGWDPMTMFPGPLKVDRPPSLRDNANVATFLASDDSQYMSGVVIPSCDGGNFARTSIPIPENWSLEDQV
jgi:NAD(P)-dependent dehydrogenase (short-subunit alcohol dehydrogenase family)